MLTYTISLSSRKRNKLKSILIFINFIPSRWFKYLWFREVPKIKIYAIEYLGLWFISIMPIYSKVFFFIWYLPKVWSYVALLINKFTAGPFVLSSSLIKLLSLFSFLIFSTVISELSFIISFISYLISYYSSFYLINK